MLSTTKTTINNVIIGGVIDARLDLLINKDKTTLYVPIRTREGRVQVTVADDDMAHYVFNNFRQGDSIVVEAFAKTIPGFGNGIYAKSIILNKGTKNNLGGTKN